MLVCLLFLPVFTNPTVTADEQVDLSQVKINDIVKDEKQLAVVLKKIGIKSTMAELVAESNGGSAFDCHQQAHQIGRIGYKIFKEEAFRNGDYSCHSGVYHGAMEAFLNENGTNNLAGNIETICNKFESSFGRFECLHGVGHGILAYDNYDVPLAISDCQKLKDSFSASSCYGGMFMENVLTGQGLGASTNSHTTAWLNKTDPYFPCDKIDQEQILQFQCYQMQTSWMLTLSGYNFDTVAKNCLGADHNYISVCFKSYGRDAAGQALRDPGKIVDYCDKVPKHSHTNPGDDYYDECITGALNVIVDFWGQGLSDQATGLCKLIGTDSKNKCYGVLATRLNDVFIKNTDRARICRTFEQDYVAQCKQNTNS